MPSAIVGGPVAILAYRNRNGYFLDVDGSGSRIASIEVNSEARAYQLADELIAIAEENA